MNKPDERNLIEKSVPGRRAAAFGAVPAPQIPAHLRRAEPARLPELSELDLVRHFTTLSRKNFSVDTHTYPLGSCTMKYNPRVNERAAALPGFADVHPYTDEDLCQGALEMLFETQRLLCSVTGFDAATLQPAAGAHGELTALLVVRAYFRSLGQNRTRIIVPDSSHGTNPASAALAGFDVLTIPSNAEGEVDLLELERALDESVAAVMLTNPNTLGLFERRIAKIAECVHRRGALLYCDGANLNALMGVFRPGDGGFDLMHINLHKTFSTPHGGGGPGSGPVCVKGFLAPFLPGPRVVRENAVYRLDCGDSRSIGRVKSFYGHTLVALKAYAYIRQLGAGGLKKATTAAVLAANYLRVRVSSAYKIPYPRTCMHEFVCVPTDAHTHTMDIAKRLIDYGIHPPTIYFPLIVKEAIMIEPTETESLEDLDRLAAALLAIAREAAETPDLLHDAPVTAPIRRLDEVGAARNPVLRSPSCDG